MEEKKEVPRGVRVISVLYYVFGSLAILFAVLNLFGIWTFGLLTFGILVFDVWTPQNYFVLISYILSFALGIMGIFIGKGLRRGKNWARVLAITLSLLAVVSIILGLLFFRFQTFSIILFSIATMGLTMSFLLFLPGLGLIYTAFVVFVILYLSFSKKVKEFFSFE